MGTSVNLQTEVATCTIGKSTAKRLKEPVPLALLESADSNFHANLYGARKRHNITTLSDLNFVTHVSTYCSHESVCF